MFQRTLIAVVVVSGLALWLGCTAHAADDTSGLKGRPAPQIDLTTLDGKAFKLSEQKGNVVVLDFWATWCPPCRASLPHLQKLHENKGYAEHGLKVFAVNAQEQSDTVKGYLQKNSLTFAVPLDASGAAMKDYIVHGIPTTVIVGRDGAIREVFIGYGGEASATAIDQAVEAALKEPKR